jgi:hypothetical protein
MYEIVFGSLLCRFEWESGDTRKTGDDVAKGRSTEDERSE